MTTCDFNHKKNWFNRIAICFFGIFCEESLCGAGHCLFCKWEMPNGHRRNQKDSQSRARALPAGASGERTGGAEPSEGAGAGAIMKWGDLPNPTSYGYADEKPPLVAVSKEIIAWRGWRLVKYEDGWRLHSVSMADVCWDGPTLVADKVPERDSPHGIYAINNRAAVVGNGYQGHCLGEVALSGVVVEGIYGYRAERATIRSLTLLGYFDVSTRPIEIMADLEERYQCEVGWEQEMPQVNYYVAASNWPSSGTQIFVPRGINGLKP